MKDLNVVSSGVFHIERVPGGTYQNAVLHAHSSGSIHALEPVTVLGKLTVIADHSGTVLLPKKIKCSSLELTSKYSSTINSNDLEVNDFCELNVTKASTCGLYMVLDGPVQGEVNESSTLNTFIKWPNGRKNIDEKVDGSSVFSQRDWNGPG